MNLHSLYLPLAILSLIPSISIAEKIYIDSPHQVILDEFARRGAICSYLDDKKYGEVKRKCVRFCSENTLTRAGQGEPLEFAFRNCTEAYEQISNADIERISTYLNAPQSKESIVSDLLEFGEELGTISNRLPKNSRERKDASRWGKNCIGSAHFIRKNDNLSLKNARNRWSNCLADLDKAKLTK